MDDNWKPLGAVAAEIVAKLKNEHDAMDARSYLRRAKQVFGDRVVDAIVNSAKGITAGELADKYQIKVTTVMEIWCASNEVMAEAAE